MSREDSDGSSGGGGGGISSTAKIGGGIGLGAGVMAMVSRFREPLAILAIIMAGIVVVVCLLAAYKAVLRWRDARKGKDFGATVRARTTSRPSQVTQGDSKVRLDDLRKKFQDGLKVFEASGKSMYSLPWYLVVGEPGSGKTEAIRRAGIPAPDALKRKFFEGGGGTINMNWWFTNVGILLDTAGRLMFPEVETAENPEWDTFLGQLNASRPNCPVNGLLLVIPADTLLRDSTEQINEKAGKIAAQFTHIQTVLGIRFPVFVLVTKCDTVPGFREFFEPLQQPAEQNQMLGWSNPASLDDPFDPGQVDACLSTVRTQLVRRRFKLLENPINRLDPMARRLDEVDSLYVFPDEFQTLGPRLRLYLEAIFTAGEWTAKPLFLRGIYFTSALQKGQVVDNALSAALGRDVAQALGEPKQSETPYFLRDVFIEKAFKERGLVTRASNVNRLARRRKLVVLSTLIVAVLALGVFTWVEQSRLEDSVGHPARYWRNLATATEKYQADYLRVVADDGGKFKYRGDDPLGDDPKHTLKGMHEEGQAVAFAPFHIPFVYRPVALAGANLGEKEPVAYQHFYEQTVMLPLVEASRKKLNDLSPDKWSDDATAALRQLIWLESDANFEKPAKGATGPATPIAPLARFVLPDYDKHRADFEAQGNKPGVFAAAFDGVFPKGAVPREPYRTGGAAAVSNGVKTFIASVSGDSIGKTDAAVKALDAALVRFDRIEKELIALTRTPADTRAGSQAYVTTFLAKMTELDAAKRELDVRLAAPEFKDLAAGQTYAAFYEKGVTGALAKRDDALRNLLGAIPTPGGSPVPALADAYAALAGARKQVEADRARLTGDAAVADFKQHEAALLTPIVGLKPEPERVYLVDYAALDRARGRLSATPTDKALDAATAIRTARREDDRDFRALREKQGLPPGANTAGACAVADYASQLAAGRGLADVFERELKSWPTAADAWGKRVATGATALKPIVPATKLDGAVAIESAYDGARAGQERSALKALAEAARLTDAPAAPAPVGAAADAAPFDLPALKAIYAQIAGGWDAYAKQGADYWQSTVPDLLAITLKDWPALRDEFGKFRAGRVTETNDAIQAVQGARDAGLAAFGQPGGKPMPDRAKFDPACAARAALWAKLPQTGLGVRDALAGLAKGWDDLADYLTNAGNGSLAETYWFGLCATALDGAKAQARADASAAVDQLKAIKKFPLVGPPPATVAEELPLPDVNAAAAAPAARPALDLAALVAKVARPAENWMSKPPPGGTDGRVSAAIAALAAAGSTANPAEQAWLDRVARFVQAAPAMRVSIEIDKKAPLPANLLNDFFFARLDVNATAGTWTDLRNPQPKDQQVTIQDVNLFRATGGAVQLILCDNGNMVAVKSPTWVRQGPWAAIALLHGMKDLKHTREGDKGVWRGSLPLQTAAAPKPGDRGYEVPLIVTFSTDVDWPSEPIKK